SKQTAPRPLGDRYRRLFQVNFTAKFGRFLHQQEKCTLEVHFGHKNKGFHATFRPMNSSRAHYRRKERDYAPGACPT
ncbi:hypothetical protein, partial [Ruegeria sp. HU-ET01832]|uniref:hypothetical protein n=1 Tax=Ruegeria sp. HU-ET01832 TaxID=3135906 RepID=UPI00333FA9DF